MERVQEHRALRFLLTVLATVITVAGLTVLFATAWVLTMAHAGAAGPTQALLMLAVRAIGAVALGLAYLLYRAALDPARYIAVIDAFIAIILMLTLVDITGVLSGGFAGAYPQNLVWTRIVVRLIVAALLIALRPRGAR